MLRKLHKNVFFFQIRCFEYCKAALVVAAAIAKFRGKNALQTG